MRILQFLSVLLTGRESLFYLVMNFGFMFGCYKVIKKCGDKGWKGFIPCYHFYALAKCAGREAEGWVLCVSNAVYLLSNAIAFLLDDLLVTQLLAVIGLTSGLVFMIYQIRVAVGLCELYGRKRGWAVVWAFFGVLSALLWGLSPKFQPRWQVSDVDEQVKTYFSGSTADVLTEGLTINIESRTARELFKTRYLLRDIHMNIAPGRMVLLLGGSGAGKTTLLNAVNGYEKAKADIHLNGGNVYTEYKRMQYEIGFVPQLDLMRGKDTVQHTLYDAAALRLPQDFTWQERHERVAKVMEIFGLMPVRNNLVDKLSGGQRKRLSIAMEFISNPSLFILDEPDSGLDGVMARELMEQLRVIANQGKIVIVITHTPDRVIDLFDDVIVLAKDANRTGRLAFYGPIPEARTFFGRETMEQIVMSVNRKEEGGDGLADEFINKFVEVQHG